MKSLEQVKTSCILKLVTAKQLLSATVQGPGGSLRRVHSLLPRDGCFHFWSSSTFYVEKLVLQKRDQDAQVYSIQISNQVLTADPSPASTCLSVSTIGYRRSLTPFMGFFNDPVITRSRFYSVFISSFSISLIMFSLSCMGVVFIISTAAAPSFPKSQVETKCSSKTPTANPELPKTQATDSSRMQILMKTQTASNDRFRLMITFPGYPCYRYCYLEKTIGNWVDLWIRSYPCHMFYYVSEKTLEEWLDFWILTSLLSVDLLYRVDVLSTQTKSFKLIMLLKKLWGMVRILSWNMSCIYVAKCLHYVGCLFAIFVMVGNLLVSLVINPAHVSYPVFETENLYQCN